MFFLLQHPNYFVDVLNAPHNDVTVLKLDRCAEITESVAPIALATLPAGAFLTNPDTYITGWGEQVGRVTPQGI